MSKPNKKTICVVVIVALLIVSAAALRNLGRYVAASSHTSFIIGVLRGMIYIGLFMTWGFSLRYRIIQTQARRFLTAISALMVFWLMVRVLKFALYIETPVVRYLWYMYYLPILFIPLLAFLISLSLGKSEQFRLPHWTRVLFGISVILLVLVLTNDLHQLVFGFPNGLQHYENGEYLHRVGYYLIMFWVALCAISAFAFIIGKCRVPYSKRHIYYPLIPLGLLIIYAILYLTALDIIHLVAGDMTVVTCILTALTLETCIQCGLIQSNTHYDELFECTSIRGMIADENYNILLSSRDALPLSKEVLRQTQAAPVMLDNGLRLCSAPIKRGHVMWSEDVSEMTELIAELADNSEYLASRRTILHKEVETRKQEQCLTEKNRLYNRLMNDNQDKYRLFHDLLDQLEVTNDHEQEKKLIAKLAVVCTHIKRRGNLLFLSEKGEEINASELRFALEEWLSNLRLYGINCTLFFSIGSTLSFSDTVTIYDTFQGVLLHTLDNLHSLLVTAGEKVEEHFLLLNMSGDFDASKLDNLGVSVSDEGDGDWVITISIPKGGAQV